MQTKKVSVRLETLASIVLYALNRLRNNLLEEGRDPACVDELFLKVANAPVKKR